MCQIYVGDMTSKLPKCESHKRFTKSCQACWEARLTDEGLSKYRANCIGHSGIAYGHDYNRATPDEMMNDPEHYDLVDVFDYR